MTLAEWQAEMLADIATFAAYWQQMHKQAPEQFPLELGSGDWDEQFAICSPGESGKSEKEI